MTQQYGREGWVGALYSGVCVLHGLEKRKGRAVECFEFELEHLVQQMIHQGGVRGALGRGGCRGDGSCGGIAGE